MLIEKHWPEIERVAYGLLQFERLSGRQVREIIERTRALALVKRHSAGTETYD
jgi:hypothetical protein